MIISLNYFYVIKSNDGILETCFLGESLKTVSEKLANYETKNQVKKIKL